MDPTVTDTAAMTAGTTSPVGAARADGPRLGRRTRRWTLLLHVVTSVGWLGVALGLLALSLTGATSASPAADTVAYGAMDVVADTLVGPLALLSLTTGLALSLGTHWGLARHRWVWTKFWLTLAATAASLTALRSGVNGAVADVAAERPVDTLSLLMPPAVSLSLYVFMTGLSVLKPWGPTRRGRRYAAARRAGTRRA